MAGLTQAEKEFFMGGSSQSQLSLQKEEIPIGCVIVKDGQIIGRGHNAREGKILPSCMPKLWLSIKQIEYKKVGVCWIVRFCHH